MTHVQLVALGWDITESSNVAYKIPRDPYEAGTHPPLPDAESPQQARPLASHREGQTQSAGGPLVCFTLRRIRLLDIDSKYGSIADLLDGLQYAGLIHGDKEGQIRLEVRQEKVSTKKEEKTLISIES